MRVSNERLAELVEVWGSNAAACKSHDLDTGISDEYVAALRELQQLRQHQWQSIERLPPSAGYYLVVYRNAKQHVRSDYFNGTSFPYDDYGKITHWQPLPPPPTVGEEGER